MIEPPFFSVIVPTFNCKPFILETIDSVKKQTFKSWELIIVDDNSTDGTFELVEKYIKESNQIKLLKTNSNYGSPGRPRDMGVQVASGKYVTFLDGDDTYQPQKLERHYNTLSKNPSIGFLHSAYRIINEKGLFIQYKKKQWFLRIYERFFNMRTVCLLTNPFCISTTVINKTLLQHHQFATIPQYVSAVEDWFLWNRLLNDKIPTIHYDSESLTNYRWVHDSISARNTHRCELQSIIFFSILLYNRQINIFEWHIAVFIRLLRVFCAKFLGYGKNIPKAMNSTK